MFPDNTLYLEVLEKYAEEASLLVSSSAMSLGEFIGHEKKSHVAEALIDGDLLYANLPAFALASAMLNELLEEEPALFEEKYASLLDAFTQKKKDLIAYWVAKTELEVAMILDRPISELREKVSAQKLLDLYPIYHVFLVPDNIISEQYERGDA